MKLAFIASFVLLLSACGLQTDIRGDRDPDIVSISKADPVFVGLPDNPTIKDKRVVPFLKDELVRSGFKVTDSIGRAAWVLCGSTDSQSFESGATYHYFTWSTTTEYDHSRAFYLVVYPEPQYAAGKRTAAWAGAISAREEDYRGAPNAMVNALLGIYGTNFEDRSFRVKKSYQDDMKDVPVPAP